MTSTIHDLGYQRYSGERLSMRSAWSALFVQGVRTMLALGRPARSKALPVFVLIFSCVPAVLTVFVSSQAGLPIRHAMYFTGVSILYVLFAAAQAPELFSRDQANRVLPLVFTRDLSPWQYFSARLASVVVTLVALAMVPQFILWLGAIGLADDTVAALRERLPILGPILAVTTLAGCLLGSVSSAIAAFTPRRHFATAAIVGLFIVLGAATAALGASDVVPMKTAELFNPVRVLDMSNRLLFDEPTRRITREAANPLSTYLAMIAAWCAVSTLAVWWRSQRVDA
jgi:ABC-2 type transport system permease protein